jgi:hypothetical protein
MDAQLGDDLSRHMQHRWRVIRLQVILNKMDVPILRQNDVRWLSRNLGIRNSAHPDFAEAMRLIKELL